MYDSVLERLVDATSKLRVGDPLSEETDIGAIINERQFGKISGYIEEGLKQSGSKRLCGGLPSDDTSLGAGYFLRPTIFAQGSNEWRMAREEIFGPVLVAIPWETEDEVIRMANDTHYGLAAYIWTHDIGKARRAARDIEAGWVQINQGAGQLPGHSYGGYKQSGLGREFSLAGMLDSYTQTKNIYGQSSTIDWDELTIADSMSLKSASVDLPPDDDMFPNGRARMRSTTIASPATQALIEAIAGSEQHLMPARPYRLLVPIRGRVMDAENSHGGKGPVPESTLASRKATCEAHFCPSNKSGPGVPCELLAVYLPILLASADAVQIYD